MSVVTKGASSVVPCAVVESPVESIPFNRPHLTGTEAEVLATVLERRHLSGDGAYTRRCNELLSEATGGGSVLLTTSCTHALDMSAMLLDIQPGDEVILPSFTFVSTADAFALRGAKVVFCDIRDDTLNLDESRLPELITARTRAVVVVHYAGVSCEMDAIGAICEERGIALVEDNAHGLYGRYRARPLGSFGCMATQSFHETKNVQCGEGGALIVNDPKLLERAEIIREKGTNRSKFFRGQVDKYTWVDIGSSYLPAEILAGLLSLQLEAAATIQNRRREIWAFYDENLQGFRERWSSRGPVIPADCEQAYHMYYLLLPSLGARTSLIRHLKSRDILAVFHYQPLHCSPMGIRYGGRIGDCPVTEDVSDRLVRLPFYFDLTGQDLARIVAALNDWPGADRT